MKEIYFAGGCFWGVEHYFSLIAGVVETEAGYANGSTEFPTYEQVCHGGTGHAEAVRVRFDSERLPLSQLLSLFYDIIDPTALNRQGADAGIQYRSGIYYVEEEDRQVILPSLQKLQERYEKPLAVEVKPLEGFYPAEQYHQEYLKKNPNGYCHIPKKMFDRAAAPQFYKKTGEELKALLTERQYEVTQRAQTEPAFKNEFYDQFEPGIYVDITTGAPLFLSNDKFDSGCGWPSFSKPIDEDSLYEKEDKSFFMNRVEVRSKVGDAHLGHVFPDGPKEREGRRYCINSAALRFVPKTRMAEEGYGAYLDKLDSEN